MGGGPAGLAAAIALRSKGCSVSLFDCANPPIDKACGEGLMPESIRALRELGVDIPARTGFPFRGVCFVDSDSRVCAEFPNGSAIGLRRTVLHQLLVDRAREVGGVLHWNTKALRFAEQALTVNGKAMRPKLVVAADGQNSALRRAAGLNKLRRECRRFGFRRHYRIAPWSEYMELHWGPRSQLYITPISECEVGVALLSSDPKLRLDTALPEFPEVASRLSSAQPLTTEMGAITALRTLQRVCRPSFALIGDASGSVDAITGEGMCLAFRQALALADAFAAGDFATYEHRHRALLRRPAVMASLLLMLANHNQLRRRVLASFAKRPQVFARFLAIHSGESSPLELCDWSLLNFGLDLLTA